MAERRAAMLAECLAAADARRARAEAAHAAAMREAAAAATAADDAQAALDHAAREWSRQMAERFDPGLGVLLAREVLARATAHETAAATLADADAARDRSAKDWHGEDARTSALEDEVAIALRRAARLADERRLSALADRETFRRCRA